MHYQSDGTQVATRPTPAVVTGTPGWVTAGDLVAGIPPSNDDPDLMNAITDEIAGVVKAAGITLDKTNNAQLLASCYKLFGGANNPSTSGYVQLPSGFILQWSSGTLATGDLDPIYFPIVFPNACFAITISEESAAGWTSGGGGPYPTIYGASSRAANGFFMSGARVTASGTTAYQAVSYSYMAIGH